MRIFLTGANGFIGSHLKAYLEKRGDEVFGCYRKKKYANKNDFIYKESLDDLIKYFKKVKPDMVIHLGALFISEHKSSDIENLIDSNIKFTNFILEAMMLNGCNKIINTGTSWQNFNNEEYSPVCLYAATKQAAQDLIHYYHKIHKINYINIKLFDTYGPNDDRNKLFHLLISFNNRKKKLKMTKGNQKINLTHVFDVCRGFELSKNILFSKKKYANEFAISSNKNIKLKELVSKFIKLNSLNINIGWGDKKYRKIEVFEPWNKYKSIPGYKPLYELEEGLKSLINK